MNKSTFIVPVILAVVLSACGNDEEVTYQAGDTKVTVNKESGISKLESSDGENKVEASFQEEGNLPMPSDFPDDIPIAVGAVLEAKIKTEELYSLRFKTTQSPAELSTFYNDQLKAKGWNIVMTNTMQDFTMIVAEKGDRNCQVHIAKEEDKTILMINVVESES